MQFIIRLSVCASLFVLLNCDYLLAASVAWYRFEEGSGSDIIDEVSGTDHGDLIGSGTTRLSSGLPTILGGEIANTGAISISGSAWQGILIDGMKFIHHGDGPAPSGDATWSFYSVVRQPVTHPFFGLMSIMMELLLLLHTMMALTVGIFIGITVRLAMVSLLPIFKLLAV